MLDWFINIYSYFESYKTKNDRVIQELHQDFATSRNTRSRAERGPLLQDLKLHFILNKTKTKAEVNCKYHYKF
jgi:hypothetical protein